MGYLLRIIILLILGWLAYRLVRRLIGSDKIQAKPADQAKIEMVPCAVCGLHIPRHEALMHDNRAYCSAAHLETGKN
ncbi:MAG: PP0621 family protein [Acidiferrobacterales bacterium]